ncbi:MAG: hypothetical protein ABJF04_00700 [Reichenbachiella sp.]|uniref:hypothetical protein n=1 Tax=Reichenbachiella sp. TaxID=2184521 RepID=UPI003266FD73
MNSKQGKSLLFFLLFLKLTTYGQLKEINWYAGAQSLNITQFNELEITGPEWDFKNAKAAFSTELSFNYFPLKNDLFFIQTGIKYFRLKSQHNTIEYITELNGIDLGGTSDIQYGEFDYGFNFQYIVCFISPSFQLKLSKGLVATIGVGAMIHRATTKQDGFQIIIDPDTFEWTNSQFTGSYQDYAFSYNLSTSLTKDLSKKLGVSLKVEYNFIKSNIGEESRSIYYGALLNQENITVPIHVRDLDLSGLNVMLGASFRLGSQ